MLARLIGLIHHHLEYYVMIRLEQSGDTINLLTITSHLRLFKIIEILLLCGDPR